MWFLCLRTKILDEIVISYVSIIILEKIVILTDNYYNIKKDCNFIYKYYELEKTVRINKNFSIIIISLELIFLIQSLYNLLIK